MFIGLLEHIYVPKNRNIDALFLIEVPKDKYIEEKIMVASFYVL